jgi:hypothetical protein
LVLQTETPRSRGDPEAVHETPVTPAEDMRTVLINEISWGAVFAGVAVALVTQLLLNMLGLGIGVATLDPGTPDNPEIRTFSVGAGLWWTVSGILAAVAGGYTAGRLAGRPKESTCAWHGLIAWAISTLVIFYLLTSAVGNIIGGAFSAATGALGQAASTAAQTAAPAIAQSADPFAGIERAVRGSGTDPAAARDAAVAALRAALTGDQAQAQAARENAARAIAQAQNISIEQAREQVVRYEQQYRQAVEQARRQAVEAAQVASTVVSRAALLGFFALVLGAIAAWFGGRAGAIEPTITSRALRAARP